MKHSADGFFLSENARSARPRSAGLLSSGTGKLDKEKTAFVRQAGRTMKVLNHTAPVTWVTYSHYITMIMCRYSAGSMSELAASAKCANSPRISPALALLEEPQGKRSWMAAQEGSPNRGPILVNGQVRSGGIPFVQQVLGPTATGAAETRGSTVLNNSTT